MLSRIAVTGVPGVGKTSVSQDPRIIDAGLAVINYGNLMLLKGRQLGLVSNSSDLKTLNLAARTKLQSEVIRTLDEESSGLGLLIDGHLIVDTPSGFIPGIKWGYLPLLRLSGLTLLIADPTEVVSRRKKNPSKYEMMPRWDVEEHVRIHQDILFAASIQYSLHFHFPCSFIRNPDGKREAAVWEVMGVLRDLVPQLYDSEG